MENNFKLNPETLRDPQLDKKKEFSAAHEEMEELQKGLKETNAEIARLTEFIKNLELQAAGVKSGSINSAKESEIQEAIILAQKDLKELEIDREEIEDEIFNMFNLHQDETEMLKSIEEEKAIEN